jgi:hypothetical protein
MGWVGQVASMEEMTYQEIVWKPEENRQLEGIGGDGRDVLKCFLKEKWRDVAQYRFQ